MSVRSAFWGKAPVFVLRFKFFLNSNLTLIILRPQAATLAKTIGIFRRNLESVDELVGGCSSWDQLKTEVVSAVEAEIQNNLSDYEVGLNRFIIIIDGQSDIKNRPA